MKSPVKKTPRSEREHDVSPKSQSLGKNCVQHLYSGIINKAITLGRPDGRNAEKAKTKLIAAANHVAIVLVRTRTSTRDLL